MRLSNPVSLSLCGRSGEASWSRSDAGHSSSVFPGVWSRWRVAKDVGVSASPGLQDTI